MKKHIDRAIYLVMSLMFGTGVTGLSLAAQAKLTLAVLLGSVTFVLLVLFFLGETHEWPEK